VDIAVASATAQSESTSALVDVDRNDLARHCWVVAIRSGDSKCWLVGCCNQGLDRRILHQDWEIAFDVMEIASRQRSYADYR